MDCLHYYLLFVALFCNVLAQNIIQLRNSHRPKELTDEQIRYLSGLSDTAHINKILDNILIPRVVGTPNHDKVYKYIVDELKNNGFALEVDEFTANTPNMGKLKFQNVIGSLNPNAERFLVLACHYDSKYFENIEFVGATDSAVPCAMMLNIIKVMGKELQEAKDNEDVSLKLIFFDGEEAFENWGPNDSIYGAKNLANAWHKSKSQTKNGFTVSELHRIDVFVLLDLIGIPDPSFYSYFKDTERWYLQLADAEKQLADFGLLEKYSNNPQQTYFKKRSSSSYIEDDHIPFLKKGVPILHLITTPFPKGWHTEKDNRASIDITTVENINKILRIFVAEFLHLAI